MKKITFHILPLLLLMAMALPASGNSNISSVSPYEQPDWGSVAPSTPLQTADWPIPEQTLSDAPDDNRTLQGGDNFGDAFVITALPFNDDGTTGGYTDDYADPCGGTSGGPDVVYSFTPPTDMIINIHLCGTSFYAVLHVYQNDITALVGCNAFSLVCGFGPPSGALDLVQLYAGNTYYIVVDGYYSSQGPYSIQVAEPPNVICPETAIPEGEPSCGDGYVDTYNQGCSDTTFAPAYTPISAGDTICGISGIYNFGSNRDADWYTVTIAETQTLTFSAVAEFPEQIGIFYAGQNCHDILNSAMNRGFGVAGETVNISANCIPGTYYFAIMPSSFNSQYNCPKEYMVWLTSSPSPPPPANDNCADVTPQLLTPDNPLEFIGDNTGATMDCVNLGIPESWIAFTIPAACSVSIDFCGTTPAYGTCFVVIADACPCGDYIFSNLYTQFICEDHNYALKWVLPPGTYYYPILTMPGIAEGPYTIHVSAVGLPQIGLDPLSFEPTVETGRTTTDILTISNDGSLDLEYAIASTQSEVSAFSDRVKQGANIGSVNTSVSGPIDTPDILSSMPSSGNGGNDMILVDCPPGSETELEICGDDFNGGCNLDPPVFEPAAVNTNICGTAWSSNDPSSRDTDWYVLAIAEPTYLTVGIISDFPTTVYLMDAAQNCPPSYAEIAMSVNPNEYLAGSIAIMPGSYWVFVAPYDYYNMPCDGTGEFTNSYVLYLMGSHAWMYAENNSGIIPVGGAPVDVDITFDAAGLAEGTYTGTLDVYSNDPVSPVINIPVTMTVIAGQGCDYVIGDINGNGSANGIDVTYGVTYLKGGAAPPDICTDCPETGQTLFGAMDVNASCSANGIDITFYVAYLKQLQPELRFCEDCPPRAQLSVSGAKPTSNIKKAPNAEGTN